MRYMFLIYSQELPGGPPPEEAGAIMQAHSTLLEEASRKGVLVGADPLKPTSTATTIRVTRGKPVITDGPFAETKEALAGYYIIECANLDEAIEWGKRIPSNCKGMSGCIEIRPIIDIPKPVG